MLYPGSPIKSLILEYLAEKRFAQAKEIISAVQKIDPKKVSFQSIYKHLGDLIEENVLEKHYQIYTFNYSYIERLNSFRTQLTEDVKRLHNMNDLMCNIDQRQKHVLNFDSMDEMADFYKELMISLIYKQREEDVTWYKYMVHFASYFMPSRSELEKQIGDVKTYNRVYGRAPIDLQVQKKTRKSLWEFETTLDQSVFKQYSEYSVHGEYSVTINYDPKRFQDYMDLVQSVKLDDRSISEYTQKYRLFSIPIEFIIEKDSEKAMQMERSIQSLEF